MTASNYNVSPGAESPRLFKILFALFVACSAGMFVGLFTVSFPLPVYLLAVLQGALLAAWYLLRAPHWTAVLFWAAYAVQSTILSGTVIRGLYYPIYLMMLVNFVTVLFLRRARLNWTLLGIYGALYTMILFSLFSVQSDVGFLLFQRLFIIGVGLLTYFQFTHKKALETFPNAQLWSGLIVAGWVIFNAVQQGFGGERGGTDGGNENYVSFIVALGALPLFASQFTLQKSVLRRALNWLLLGVVLYAMLLLASRGMTIALVMALLVIFLRVIRDTRRSVPIILLAVVFAAGIFALPGSENLLDRFSASDLSSGNGRLPLWLAGISALRQSAPLELLFGHGLDYSLVVTAGVMGFPFSMHNAYLQYLLDFGFLGLFLFLALHGAIMWMVWRAKTRQSLVALGAIVFLMMANLTTTTADEFFYWVVIGYCMAVAAQAGKPDISRNVASDVPYLPTEPDSAAGRSSSALTADNG